ncbi:MAG TPA: hypothetical protein VGF55_08035 [Gemmataceae bacterium]|jgi:hypothetical protein
MTTVRFTTWRPGLNKVALDKLIRERGGLPLGEAHELVNRLLDGEQPEIQIASQADAQRLVQEACALGAQAECVTTSPSGSPVG